MQQLKRASAAGHHRPHHTIHQPVHGVRVTKALRWALHGGTLITRSSNSEGPQDNSTSQLLPVVAAGVLTAVAGASLTLGRDSLADWFFEESLSAGPGLGAGDLLGGVLWSASLWYCTPVQLILLFFGKIDYERPSDVVLQGLGQALGQPVDAIDYVAPLYVRAAAAAVFLASGVAISATLGLGLGDATWSISSGLGACVAAAVYEVGRPRRMSVEEAQLLEAQWQDFAAFARQRLIMSGRCHESEVFKEFRLSSPRYRRPGAISDEVLRDMVRNLSSDIDRTPKGFLKGISVKPRVDAFTGERVGGSPQQQAIAASGPGSVIDPRQLLGEDADTVGPVSVSVPGTDSGEMGSQQSQQQ